MNNYKATPKHQATPEQWAKIERFAKVANYVEDSCILELRARVEALEAQANHIPDVPKMVPPPVATEGNKKPAVINVVMNGDPPAPHEKWEDWFVEDWFVEAFQTQCIKGVRLRAIAPGDFLFDEEEATPPPVATDEELIKIWNKTGGSIWEKMRAIYNYGQASRRKVAEPAPVAGGLVERVARVIGGIGEGGDWSPEARAAILEVARWLREQGLIQSAISIEREAGR